MNMDLIPGQNTTNHVRLLACIITCVCVCVCVCAYCTYVRTVQMCTIYMYTLFMCAYRTCVVTTCVCTCAYCMCVYNTGSCSLNVCYKYVVHTVPCVHIMHTSCINK